ncbi:uncharacterized protein MONBRDRAFT_7009 [Monosiga brevicollis MX1]|uniref:Orc1-like AAA ATPase domain-containing protein n=1 Tax=Monosiga brevicollis TaxID=81824 RepID=A9UVM5_MONBE|nr:uncharacterized protein MONBRDRAFT_7009 [Monosiga brevicollis MX1]EDQ90421.1 predicted protein [Monosiga brevicollis MX1]|eukprot:XP_001744472.1 hypothetical protein [Monosiga brevicollis MX1]
MALVGHEELSRRIDTFLNGARMGDASRHLVLRGGSGTGRTSLLAAVTQRWAHRLDVVSWVTKFGISRMPFAGLRQLLLFRNNQQSCSLPMSTPLGAPPSLARLVNACNTAQDATASGNAVMTDVGDADAARARKHSASLLIPPRAAYCDFAVTLLRNTVVLIDDFDQMDPDSRDVLLHLAATRAVLALVVTVLPHVPVLPPGIPSQLLATTELILRPLTTEQLGRLACCQLNLKVLPPTMHELLHTHGRGNPLFCVSILKLLQQAKAQHHFDQAGGDWLSLLHVGKPGASVALAAHQVLQQVHLGCLPAAAMHVLKCSAVVGPVFTAQDLIDLGHAGTSSAHKLFELLHVLQDAALIQALPGPASAATFAFCHASTRSFVLKQWPIILRQRLHAQVASLWESQLKAGVARGLLRPDDRLERLYRISDQWESAGQTQSMYMTWLSIAEEHFHDGDHYSGIKTLEALIAPESTLVQPLRRCVEVLLHNHAQAQ